MHFPHFLADFNFLHTACILKLFSTAFQPLSVLVMFFSDTPDITPKLDAIFRVRDNSITLFFPFSSFYTCSWLAWKCWFCLNCEILCLYLVTFVVFAVNLCFNSSVTSFIPFFFTLYLVFSPLIFLFLFPPVSPRLSLFSLFISLLRLPISLSILLFHHGSFFSPLLPFFTTTSFPTQRAAAKVSLFVWVKSSVSICLTTAFIFLVTLLFHYVS